MPRDPKIKKVIVIGSGPIVIGQAAEFDYAGAQACRVLRAEGVDTVLVNSNPATIMTDAALADEIYLEPLNEETLKRVIEKEKPDSLLASLGGQTGLTLAMKLSRDGWLAAHGVRLLGTDAEAISRAEDRELFKKTMEELGQPTIPSDIANDVETALAIAEKIKYPVIVRPAFTLGGSGGGIAYNAEELRSVAAIGLDTSPIRQILVERYIYGWKEIEFETVRDSAGNAVAVCSMENFDPVGVHTGDSIVAAPALTLSDKEYQMLRTASLDIISALGIVGGCNCQFALLPDSFDYAVIEVNPRVSRSSALASKATGYPIAKITTKLALGYTLDEITNEITGKTCACFEPTVDYVVVKFPKWPFDKFPGSDRTLGTQMKATGEVMAIAQSFEAAVMKAVRGAEISLDTLDRADDGTPVLERLKRMDDHRLFTVFEALRKGVGVDEISAVTRIDKYFVACLKKLADFENAVEGRAPTEDEYLRAKRLGFTDKALERLTAHPLPPHRDAVYKMVDTCAAEFDAETPYFYSTYDSACDSRRFARSGKPVIIVLGSGPIRIGQGIEFDYSSVHCVRTLKEIGYDVVIINNNPETVSTDYDTADRLYFEPLCEEDVMNVIRAENPVGVVVAFGGQTAIKLAKYLDESGVKILGTSADGIDTAEDRERFDALLGKLSILRPKGLSVTTEEGALAAAEELGYPVLLRPSYVIGGQNMTIAHDARDVSVYMKRILAGGISNPVLCDKYMPGPELEVDVISDGTDVLIPGIMQHIERAGVHSGDSIAVYPTYNVGDLMLKKLVDHSTKLALSLGTKGLVNIQYLIYENELYVIEVNPRASRTVPYISKVSGVPMVDIASRVMCGATLRELGCGTGLCPAPPYYAVKVPVFSFEKLTDVNAYLGPEMKSTGEALGIGRSLPEALFKGLTAAGIKVVSPHDTNAGVGVFLSVDAHDLLEVVGLAKKFDDLGLKLYATPDTADSIASLGIDVERVPGVRESDAAFKLIESGAVSYVVYTGAVYDDTIEDYIALHRRALAHSVACFTSLDTANSLADIIASRYNAFNTELVDIAHMRSERPRLRFTKMQGSGNDYIFFENFDGALPAPESLCVTLCDRAKGVGGDGIVYIERSEVADAKMRIFNRDGSEGLMAGNSIRCVGKYLHDKGFVSGDELTVETASGIKKLRLYLTNGRVTSVTVDMGQVDFDPASLPCALDGEVIDRELTAGGETRRVTCLSVGNPHCVIFCDRVDAVDVPRVGALFEHAEAFPDRINVEFVRVVNPSTLKMRVWERGNGETLACGTGACAGAVAAMRLGLCRSDGDVTVKLPGGDLHVRVEDGHVMLTGDAAFVYEGDVEI